MDPHIGSWTQVGKSGDRVNTNFGVGLNNRLYTIEALGSLCEVKPK